MHPGGRLRGHCAADADADGLRRCCHLQLSGRPALRASTSCLLPSCTQLCTLELRCGRPRLRLLQNLPFYRIFAADARCPRDGRHLEQLGHYDPIPGKQHCCSSKENGCVAAAALVAPCMAGCCSAGCFSPWRGGGALLLFHKANGCSQRPPQARTATSR